MAANTTPGPGADAVVRPANPAGGLVEYLRGVRSELKKAEWPSRAELIRLTQVVLILIAIVAVFCGGLDGLLGLVTNRLFNRQ